MPLAPPIRQFDLCGLPAEELVAGLEVPKDTNLAGVRVLLRIIDPAGRIVVTHLGDLGDGWRWNTSSLPEPAFLYGDTRFTPHTSDTYALEVAVVEGGAPHVTGQIILSGGGWQ